LAKKLISTVFVVVILTPLITAQESTREGWINVIWGDNNPDLEWQSVNKVMFSNEQETLELMLEEPQLELLGGLMAINNQFAQVTGLTDYRSNGINTVWVSSIWIRLDSRSQRDVSGSQPWITLPMKFSDVATEPENQAFFQNMYANTPAGLDHYWREVSYNKIDIAGSISTDWYTLPNTHNHYVPNPGSGADANLSALFDDTITTVDADIDFSRGGSDAFAGINIMFNDLLDCCAWGGSRGATIDGVSKNWRVTWEPPWGYANEAVIAHEMGHGFGLPHSNNFDGDDSPYDNPWDVMSAATSYSVFNATYGGLGKHVCAYHKEILGWYPAGTTLELTSQGSQQLTIDHAALSGTPNYFALIIPYGPSPFTFYTVEVRKQVGNYDGNVPANAVLIYQVNTARDEPAWLYDTDVPPSDFANNQGSYWVPGETFTDLANEITISVLQETTNGFVVSVQIGDCDPMQNLMDNLTQWPSENILEFLDLMDCQ